MRLLLLRAGRASIRTWLRAASLDSGLWQIARSAYDRLADRAPWPSGLVLRLQLAFSVLPGAALYTALRETGRSPQEASDVIARSLAAMASPRRRFYRRLACSRSGRRLFMWLAARSLHIFPAPGWQATWIERSPRRVAFDFTRCFDLDMLALLDAAPIAPGYCAVDDILYTNLCPRLRWARSGTLATGADRCDFRFEHVPVPHGTAPSQAQR
jgi:hypothetical protein